MHVVAAVFLAGYVIFGLWYAVERSQNPAVHPAQVLIEATLWLPIAMVDMAKAFSWWMRCRT